MLGLSIVGSYVYQKCRAEQRKTAEIEALSQALERYASQVALEQVDRPIVDAVRRELASSCSPRLEEKVKDMDLAARREFFAGIVRNVARAMQVDIKKPVVRRPRCRPYRPLPQRRLRHPPHHHRRRDQWPTRASRIHNMPRAAACTAIHIVHRRPLGILRPPQGPMAFRIHSLISQRATESEAMFRAYRCQMLELDANNFASAVTKNII